MLSMLPFPARYLNYGQAVNRAHPLNRGLVSWWMNLPQRGKGNTFFDIAGRNHGTLLNGPVWSGPPHPGGWGSLSFITDDKVSVTTHSTLNIGSGDWSVFAWVYRVTGATTNGNIFEKRSGSDFWLLMLNTNTDARFWIRTATGPQDLA